MLFYLSKGEGRGVVAVPQREVTAGVPVGGFKDPRYVWSLYWMVGDSIDGVHGGEIRWI